MKNDVRCLRRELEECNALLATLPQDAPGWETAALRRKLHRLTERLAAELWEITKIIEGIDDPELRLIFELRYFRGYTWHEVATHLPTIMSGDGARMKHDRYLHGKGAKTAPTAEK